MSKKAGKFHYNRLNKLHLILDKNKDAELEGKLDIARNAPVRVWGYQRRIIDPKEHHVDESTAAHDMYVTWKKGYCSKKDQDPYPNLTLCSPIDRLYIYQSLDIMIDLILKNKAEAVTSPIKWIRVLAKLVYQNIDVNKAYHQFKNDLFYYRSLTEASYLTTKQTELSLRRGFILYSREPNHMLSAKKALFWSML